jgi:hypothetical protein
VQACAHTSFDSNRHSVDPSWRTRFHHRKPTSSRPLTFLTVQKSRTSSSTMTIKLSTKLLERKLQSKYAPRALERKKKRKKTDHGCLGALASAWARTSSSSSSVIVHAFRILVIMCSSLSIAIISVLLLIIIISSIVIMHVDIITLTENILEWLGRDGGAAEIIIVCSRGSCCRSSPLVGRHCAEIIVVLLLCCTLRSPVSTAQH